MSDRNRETVRSQKGVALIICLVVLLVLSMLAAALISVTQTEMWSSANYRLLTQSRYAAEAGAQQAINWIKNSYTPPTSSNLNSFDMTKTPVLYQNSPVVLSAMSGTSNSSNYPDSTVQSAFNTALNNQAVTGLPNATYSAKAELLSMRAGTGAFGNPGAVYLQTWQITSQGSITGVRNAQTQVIETIERTGTPIFSYAVFATSNTCGAITFSGGAFTDSYNSSQGSYAATHQNTNGNVGTNGNVNLSGGPTTINGTDSTPYPTTGSCSSGAGMTGLTGATVTGGVLPLTNPPVYPTPPPIVPAPPTTSQSFAGSCGGVSGCTVLGPKSVGLAPGTYGDVAVSGGTSINLSAGTYNMNSLVMSGGSPLVVASGPVVLNIAGTGQSTAIDLTGGTITNNTGFPSNFQIVYGGNANVVLTGGSGSYAVVYAPNAPITMAGGADWYGAIIGSTITDSGGASVHYDSSLQNNFFTVKNYNLIGFSWSKN